MIKWIKTKDRLPTKEDLRPNKFREGYVVYEGTFLCCVEFYNCVVANFVMPPKDEGGYYTGYFQGWQPEEVTHWAKINLPEK